MFKIRCLNFQFGFSSKFSVDATFVPRHRPLKSSDVDCFTHFLTKHERILVLTGAGISTECGIPDYRSELVGLYARSNYKPIQYQEFIKSSYCRRRYWARSFLGWPRIAKSEPSPAMKKLAALKNKIEIVTQNVDGLHKKAGSPNVVELHGALQRVICLQCGDLTSRMDLQRKMAELNPDMKVSVSTIRPDGDVDISEEQIQSFKTVDCVQCGGTLKPDIVFFGDNVPAERVNRVNAMVHRNEALLVIGSSLTVYSSYRIAQLAQSLQKYIFILNIGETRADLLANLKLNVRIHDIFSAINV